MTYHSRFGPGSFLSRTGEPIIVRMGKKNETTKPAAAIAESPAPKKPAKPVLEAAAAPAANGDGAPPKDAVTKPAVAKASARKPPAKKKAPARKPVTFSTEDIALRAYFIAEDRHRHGIAGDSHSDWIEAERQLRAETKKKSAKKPVRSKKRA